MELISTEILEESYIKGDFNLPYFDEMFFYVDYKKETANITLTYKVSQSGKAVCIIKAKCNYRFIDEERTIRNAANQAKTLVEFVVSHLVAEYFERFVIVLPIKEPAFEQVANALLQSMNARN